MQPLLTIEHSDPDADVLVITNMWPDEERPVYGVFVQRQVQSLIEAGLRCDIAYIRGYRSPLAYPVAALRFAVWSLTRRGRYRLVHVHAGETTLPARFLVGPPMLCSYCGDDLLGDPGEDGQKTRGSLARAWVIRQVSRTLAATITKSAEMEKALPPRRRHVNSVVPNGVDERTFRVFEDRAAARERFAFSDEEVVALFAATKPDIPRKRRALAEAACSDAAARLGRPVRLHVARDVRPKEMPALMNACDVLLHTSALEGSPNAVKEALMCNLPIVATPSGDIEELLRGVEPSFLCAPDESMLGEAIAACAGKRSNGRDVAQRLKAGNVAERVIGIYNRIGRAPRRAELAAGSG
jgi:glycosyltransferase involved in cell wall biosynthesis